MWCHFVLHDFPCHRRREIDHEFKLTHLLTCPRLFSMPSTVSFNSSDDIWLCESGEKCIDVLKLLKRVRLSENLAKWKHNCNNHTIWFSQWYVLVKFNFRWMFMLLEICGFLCELGGCTQSHVYPWQERKYLLQIKGFIFIHLFIYFWRQSIWIFPGLLGTWHQPASVSN